LPGTFDLGFTAGLMMKDVGLALSEAKALGVPMDIGEAVARALQLTCKEIGPEKDVTTVVQPIERRAGVEVRALGSKS
jgi:3-hydroxyisobutyrate dehydrogenase-like beta-hydroxyacid dehydrogenase